MVLPQRNLAPSSGRNEGRNGRHQGRSETMRVRFMGCMAAVLMFALSAQTASACHSCKRNPCVMPAPQPAYQCVTELVPYTVYKNHWRTEYEAVTRGVRVGEPVTNYVERQRVVCRRVYDTVEVPRQRMV